LGALFFVHRRNTQLHAARNDLKISNDELASANNLLASRDQGDRSLIFFLPKSLRISIISCIFAALLLNL